jgi:hypothetical protein
MRNIRMGLLQNLDVSLFADTSLDHYQMDEIRRNLLKQKKTI